MNIKIMIDRIMECQTIGELEHIESLFKEQFKGLDKVDFEKAWLKKYYEIKEKIS